MKTLSRRTALAAVPALAAATTLPNIEGATAGSLALSPNIADACARWKAHHDAGDNANAQSRQLDAATQARAGIVRPDPNTSAQAWHAYFEMMEAQPEHIESNRLGEFASEQWSLAWRCTDEVVALQAETLGDLVAQLEVFIADSSERNRDGSISSMLIDNNALPFVRNLPSEVRRLAGAS